ncbi:MAG: hypothetical protein QXP18_06570, partial [Sulfolobales archaeon]
QHMVVGTTYRSIPVIDIQVPNRAIYIVSTRPGTASIKIPEGGVWNWTGNWVKYDSFTITEGGKLNTYYTDTPLGCFRLDVKLNTDGIVTAWTMLEP